MIPVTYERWFLLRLVKPDITGNKDPRMLMRYTHLRTEDLVKRLG